MYQVALIGCGRIAPAHLESLTSLSKRARVAAICDMNQSLRQERQKAYGVSQGFDSVDELLAWDAFDIAVVLTPPHVRSIVCLPLLRAGKHVLVEKPFTHTLEEAHMIVNAAESAEVTLAVSQNFRWFPPAPTLREHILNGRIGQVLSLTRIDTGWRDETAGWRNTTDKLAISVMGVHWLDQIRWIMGEEAIRIYSSTLVSGLLSSIGEDITSTVITFRSGAVATLVHHWASYTRRANNSLQIEGTEGAVIVQGNQTRWIDAYGIESVEEVMKFSVPQSIERSWVEFLDSLDENRSPCHNGLDNLNTVALLEGAYRSAATGESFVIKTLDEEV